MKIIKDHMFEDANVLYLMEGENQYVLQDFTGEINAGDYREYFDNVNDAESEFNRYIRDYMQLTLTE